MCKMEGIKDRMDKVLKIYKSDCIFLREVDVDYPIGNGVFILGKTYYTNENLDHMTSIEAQLCLNQLSYVCFTEWILEGRFKGLEDLSFEDYLRLMEENMLIIDSKIRFKKPIENGQIIGQIEVTRIKKYGNLYITFLDFNLEGKCFGELELVLKK